MRKGRFPTLAVIVLVFVGNKLMDQEKVDPIPWLEGYSYKEENLKKFEEIAKQVCKDKNIHFIDIMKEWEKENYKKLLADGIHPTTEGHRKIFEIVKDYLLKNKILKV